MPDKKVLWLTMQKAIKSNQSINQSINQLQLERPKMSMGQAKKAKHSYVLCSEHGLNHNPKANKESH
jgi:hypothetical protein